MDLRRIPIQADPHLSLPLKGVLEAIDGFTPVERLVEGRTAGETAEIVDFLSARAREGRIVWLDEWSPLRWCATCNVPLLHARCSRCGAPAADPIPLKFPCNPRPLLPHDKSLFLGAGLSWPPKHSVVVNGYRRPDFLGWELIQDGERIGDIVMMEGCGETRFEPAAGFDPNRPAKTPGEPVTMQTLAEANQDHLDQVEQEAVDFIRAQCKGMLTFPAATFSGGKDSAVLAHLCHRSRIGMRVIQIDTGIDPPENREYSEQFLARFPSLKHQRLESRDIFWRALEKLGPPADDFQWCRTILKNSAPYRLGLMEQLGLVKRLQRFKNVLPIRGVMIEGTRRREEEWRIELKRVIPIADAPVRTNIIRPILDFTDLDIWMYFHRHDLPMNPTYERHCHQRLVCIFCPDKDREEFASQKQACPELWARFEAEARRWQKRLGYPDEWVDEHLWRHQKPVSSRMRELGIESRIDKVAARLDHVVELEHEEPIHSRYRAEGRIAVPFDCAALKGWFGLLGPASRSVNKDEALFKTPEGTIRFDLSGSLSVESHTRQSCRELASVTRRLAVSSLNCIGCGLCRSLVPAIRIQGNRATLRKMKRGSLALARKIVELCPLNGDGVRRYLVLRQDS